MIIAIGQAEKYRALAKFGGRNRTTGSLVKLWTLPGKGHTQQTQT
jgi:hypothetical protein